MEYDLSLNDDNGTLVADRDRSRPILQVATADTHDDVGVDGDGDDDADVDPDGALTDEAKRKGEG